MLDRAGQPPLSAGDLAYDKGTLEAFVIALRGRWRRRRFGNFRRATALTTIAAARDGLCRVRGLAHVLRPASGPRGAHVGAFAAQRVSEMDAGLAPVSYRYGGESRLVIVRVELTMRCGRFAVVDDSGVAIVDDDCFFVDYADGQPLEERGAGVAVVTDGAPVELLGPARWRPASDTKEIALHRGGYRAAPAALVFDGTPRDRVAILV